MSHIAMQLRHPFCADILLATLLINGDCLGQARMAEREDPFKLDHKVATNEKAQPTNSISRNVAFFMHS
jgi:hypothetical protein